MLSFSGGDWALQRTGLIFLEQTEDVAIKGCTLTRNDGVGIIVSGYNRRTILSDNEIVWNGDSAMVGVLNIDLSEVEEVEMGVLQTIF